MKRGFFGCCRPAWAALLATALFAASGYGAELSLSYGERPRELLEALSPGPLQRQLQSCLDQAPRSTPFSIGHRGAALRYAEHTRASYLAAARQGAGVIECDATFTRDRQLVCRHAQCDLHETTNILATPLAMRCREPFRAAEFAADGALQRAAGARCCTSDIDLAAFRGLRGRRPLTNPRASSVAEYLGEDFGAEGAAGELLTHRESIALIDGLGLALAPELKAPEVEMPFQGDYTQQDYARQLLDEIRAAGVSPARVWLQSFSAADILFWRELDPDYARQAVLLEGAETAAQLPDAAKLQSYAARGIANIGAPLWSLLRLDRNGRIVPSIYAEAARAAGLGIIAWTLERSGPLAAGGGWYYQGLQPAIHGDGDMLRVLDSLAQQVGVRAVFSDWPATVTYYANCFGID